MSVEMTNVTAVTGSPAFTKSRIDTVTPSRAATWTTMTLHARRESSHCPQAWNSSRGEPQPSRSLRDNLGEEQDRRKHC